MSVLDYFRPRRLTDPLDDAAGEVTKALGVFNDAKAGLEKATSLYEHEKTMALAYIRDYQARHDLAHAASEDAKKIVGKIESLLS